MSFRQNNLIWWSTEIIFKIDSFIARCELQNGLRWNPAGLLVSTFQFQTLWLETKVRNHLIPLSLAWKQPYCWSFVNWFGNFDSQNVAVFAIACIYGHRRCVPFTETFHIPCLNHDRQMTTFVVIKKLFCGYRYTSSFSGICSGWESVVSSVFLFFF